MKSRTLSRAIIAGAIAVVLTGSAKPAISGGFADDWLDNMQTTTTGAGYFEGQKRGYMAAGGFSARWPMTGNENLFSVQLPKISAGCGGVDAFWGGMSVMGFDHLVKKLQNVLQAAPSVAFSLALKNLCEQCNSVITELTSMADKINGIQLGDCQAATALAHAVADSDPIKGINNSMKESLVSQKITGFLGDTSSLLHKGNETFQKGIKEYNNLMSYSGTSPNQAKSINRSECPADLVRLIPSDPDENIMAQRSVLDTINTELGKPFTSGHIAYLRGIMGDVAIGSMASGNRADVVSPCEAVPNLDALTKGKAQVRKTLRGECEPEATTMNNLRDHMRDKLLKIALQMKSSAGKSTGLSADDTRFIESSPLPVYSILNTASRAGMEVPVINSISEIIANAYMMYMIDDIYTRTARLAWAAEDLKAKQPGSEKCDLDKALPGISAALKTFSEGTRAFHRDIKTSYIASANEYNTIQSVLSSIQNMGDRIDRELASQFGPAVAKRYTRGK